MLADEPTGNLDTKSGTEIMAILKELHASGNTIVMITHDKELANKAERVIEIRDGRIQ
jgi:ABC-type lipoprotein export system ATPase subunit